jgi:hypothetical protein
MFEPRGRQEFAHPSTRAGAFIANVPSSTMVVGRIEERTLQRGNGPIDSAFTPTGDMDQRGLGCCTKGLTCIGRQRSA